MLKLAIFFAMLCLSLTAQDKKFAGTWEARFDGRVFLTVKLLEDTKISGTVSTGNITVDDNGALVKGEPADDGRESEILKARVVGDTLSFEIVDGDDGPLKFELHLMGNGRAELRFMNAPIKPLPVLRA